MDARIINDYFSSALYFYHFELSPADLRAFNADGFAAVYIPIALFIFSIPGAIFGVIVRWINECKR